jgi:hypothetical protein
MNLLILLGTENCNCAPAFENSLLGRIPPPLRLLWKIGRFFAQTTWWIRYPLFTSTGPPMHICITPNPAPHMMSNERYGKGLFKNAISNSLTPSLCGSEAVLGLI